MSDKNTEITPVYTQEEIDSARESLKNMTPEDLLEMRSELDRAYSNQTIPEAVAICFTEVYSAKGNKINITCRGMTGRQAVDELADTLRFAREKYGMSVATQPTNLISQHTPQPPDSSEPVYVPDEIATGPIPSAPVPTSAPLPATVDIVVSSITRERKRDGTGDFLKVRGGMYTKYGVPAYDNIFPQGFDITKMQYGVEVNIIPREMQHARVDTRKPGTKAIQFFP